MSLSLGKILGRFSANPMVSREQTTALGAWCVGVLRDGVNVLWCKRPVLVCVSRVSLSTALLPSPLFFYLAAAAADQIFQQQKGGGQGPHAVPQGRRQCAREKKNEGEAGAADPAARGRGRARGGGGRRNRERGGRELFVVPCTATHRSFVSRCAVRRVLSCCCSERVRAVGFHLPACVLKVEPDFCLEICFLDLLQLCVQTWSFCRGSWDVHHPLPTVGGTLQVS